MPTLTLEHNDRNFLKQAIYKQLSHHQPFYVNYQLPPKKNAKKHMSLNPSYLEKTSPQNPPAKPPASCACFQANVTLKTFRAITSSAPRP